jgi:hypothetical protein
MLLKSIMALLALNVMCQGALARFSGYCQQGGKVVTINSGLNSGAQKFQQSFPGASLYVYLTGTTTQATLYSNLSSTPLSQPVSCNSTGYFYFYAEQATYDEAFFGNGVATPFTLGGIGQVSPNGVAGVITPQQFGAKGDGTTDDTSAFISAMTAASGGQVVWCPKSVYKISAPIYLPPYVTFNGPPASLETGYPASGGCTLKWGGASPATPYVAGSAMVIAHNAYGTHVSGVNLDGSGTANLSGYMIDTDNVLSSQQNSFGFSLLQNFGTPATGVAGACMVFGVGVGAQQVDGNDIGNFRCLAAKIGAVINSRNFDYSSVHNFAMGVINIGLDIPLGGYAKYSVGAFGPMVGVSPRAVNIHGAHDPMVFELLQAEGDLGTGSPAQMFYLDASAPTTYVPLSFIANTSDFPSTFAQTCKIVAIGNLWNSTVTLAASDILASGSGNTFTSGNPITSGANSNWDESTPGFDTTNNALFVKKNNDSGLGVFNTEFRVTGGGTTDGLLFTGFSTQKWLLFYSATKFGFQDVSGSNFQPFAIDTGLSGIDGISVHHNYTTINNVTIDSSRRLVYYVQTQGGVNNAITITTANGLAPNLGDTYTISLPNNTLQTGANTLSVNGGAATPILQSHNSSGIVSPYSINGQITVIYSPGGIFRDISQ